MRHSPKVEFIHANANLIGVFFEANCLAEHENGIDGLRQLFGCAAVESLVGCKSTIAPELHIVEQGDQMILGVGYRWSCRELSGNSELDGAWNESSFAIVASGKDAVRKLKMLKEAIEQKNVSVYMSGRNFLDFIFPGLVIMITNKVPKSLRT